MKKTCFLVIFLSITIKLFFIIAVFLSFSGCNNDLYENTIHQNNTKLKVTEKYFDELRLDSNFNKAFAKLSKSGPSKNSSIQGKKSVEENYAFTFSNLTAKVIEADNKTTYTFLIYSTNNNKEESFENLVIEIDSIQEVKAVIVKYIPKKINTTLKNHIYFEGNIEIKPILYNHPKTNKTSKTSEYELYCITEAVLACSHVPYNCYGEICGFTYVNICRLAGGGGSVVSFGPAGNTTSSGGAINYGGGSSTTSPDSIQANYITTIPVYDTLQQQFVISLKKAGNYFSELSPFSQKIIFEYLSYTEYEDPIKTNVKDALMQMDLNWLKLQGTFNQITIINYLVENDFSISSRDFVVGIKNQIQLNPDLHIDINSSLKSPFNIDRSAIIDTSPEGIKFNTVYDALLKSPEFKKLFLDLFQDSNRFNVKFLIGNIASGASGDTDTDLSNPTLNTITISPGFLMSNNKMTIAKTIIHECIHAYLNVKLCDTGQGISIPTLNNLDYFNVVNQQYNGFNGSQDQHNFIYNFILPILENILAQVKDTLVTSQNNVEILNDVVVHIPNNNSPATPFVWADYYHNLSLNGLQNCSFFQNEIGLVQVVNGVLIPTNTINQVLMQSFIQYTIVSSNIHP